MKKNYKNGLTMLVFSSIIVNASEKVIVSDNHIVLHTHLKLRRNTQEAEEAPLLRV